VDVEKQKRQIEKMLESSASSSDLCSPSETESSSVESEDLGKRSGSHLMNGHMYL
jgi:hypothetical protein